MTRSKKLLYIAVGLIACLCSTGIGILNIQAAVEVNAAIDELSGALSRLKSARSAPADAPRAEAPKPPNSGAIGVAPLAVFSGTVCIGYMACSEATTENCSIALGDYVQLPKGARNVIATVDGVKPLPRITEEIAHRINQEGRRFTSKLTVFPRSAVVEWNIRCAGLGPLRK